MTSLNFEAVGTYWQIDIYENSGSFPHKLEKKLMTAIEQFDSNYSRFRKDSWISTYSYKECSTEVPSEFDNLFLLYEKLYELSGGLFTPLIGSVLEQAGYDRTYSLVPKKMSSPPSLSEAIQYKHPKITFKKKVLLDFGAAGKGYLVDLLSKIIESRGFHFYCIDASGDIKVKNEKKPITVGLEHPSDSNIAVGICNLFNKSICASSGSRRKWSTFHHTINPYTLTSPSDVTATWVVADTTFLADALATCLFLDPNPNKYEDFKFDYVILYKDNSAHISENFPGTLFT